MLIRHYCINSLALRIEQQTKERRTRWYSSACEKALAEDAARRRDAVVKWFLRGLARAAIAISRKGLVLE
jgi:predicted metalloenzyme YecM